MSHSGQSEGSVTGWLCRMRCIWECSFFHLVVPPSPKTDVLNLGSANGWSELRGSLRACVGKNYILIYTKIH